MSYFEESVLFKAGDFMQPLADASVVNQSLVIAYHGDGDGCASAFLVQRFLKSPAHFYWVATPDFDFEKTENHVLRRKPRLAIFLDMPVYNRPAMIERLADQGTKVFIFDHHYPGACLVCDDKPNVLYLNPVRSHDKVAYPTCLFGWELLQDKTSLDKEVLFMGLYTETWLERIPLFQEFTLDRQEKLKELARLIHSSFLVQERGTSHHALDLLFKAAKSNELLMGDVLKRTEHHALSNISELVSHEKTWLLKEVMASVEKLFQPRYILIRVDSKIRVCGLIASELRWKYPTLVVGIWQKWEDRFICELRRGGACHVNLASLIEQLGSEIPLLTGGGHPEAAAFASREDTFFLAIRKIRDLLNESAIGR